MDVRRRNAATLIALLAAISAGILCYSQTPALDWDEGFHLVAAFVIHSGKRPYLDFCFPQTSLHAYWNAFWIAALGRSWRGPQLVASALASGALWLAAGFVYRRTRDLGSAMVASVLLGLSPIVFEWGTKAQAYGAGLFLTVAAFRATVAAVEKRSLLGAALAGLLGCTAASCSLLTAPAGIVLFLWMVWQVREFKLPAVFIGGALVPLAPVVQSFIQAPYVTWFNLVSYHIFYRHVKWEGAGVHDLEVLASWSNSARVVLMGALAAAAIFSLRKSDWPRERKAPFYLSLWLAFGLTLESAVAHPTFGQYFIFVIPFLAMPAAIGFFQLTSRFAIPPVRTAAVISLVLLLSLAHALVLFADDNEITWSDLADVAAKVKEVTPASAPLLADPHIYFLLGRVPPSGAEFPASHRLELPPDMAAKLHIMPQSVMERRVQAGDFATVETCDDEQVKAMHLSTLFEHHSEISSCSVYWGYKKSTK